MVGCGSLQPQTTKTRVDIYLLWLPMFVILYSGKILNSPVFVYFEHTQMVQRLECMKSFAQDYIQDHLILFRTAIMNMVAAYHGLGWWIEKEACAMSRKVQIPIPIFSTALRPTLIRYPSHPIIKWTTLQTMATTERWKLIAFNYIHVHVIMTIGNRMKIYIFPKSLNESYWFNM